MIPNGKQNESEEGILHMKKIFYLLLCLMMACPLASCKAFGGKKNEALVLEMKRGEEFKIVQFADLHFGKEGEQYHNADEARTVAFMDRLVETEKPDLIVLSGDNIMNTGVKGVKELIDIMDAYQTPYTFIFGNHDAESSLSGFCKRDVSDYLEQSDSPYLLYRAGYTDNTSENRYGNFSISLTDEETGDLLGALVMIDTGTYDYDAGRYQSITEGQIDWYKNEIGRLNEIYSRQKHNEHEIIPTLTYGHIQLPEHFIAYEKAASGDGAVFVYEQSLGGWMSNTVQGNAGAAPSPFYTAMKEMGSARSYLCGHMHGLSYHVRMDGILLGFCPQIGVSTNQAKPCKTFVYSFDERFELSLRLAEEE